MIASNYEHDPADAYTLECPCCGSLEIDVAESAIDGDEPVCLCKTCHIHDDLSAFVVYVQP